MYSLYGEHSGFQALLDKKIKAKIRAIGLVSQNFRAKIRIFNAFLACLNNVHGELLYYTQRQDRHPQMLKFSLKFFKTSLFPNLITDLIHLWYDDTYWSKILCSTCIPTTLGHVKVKVKDLELFSNLITDLIHLWFDENFAQCNPSTPPAPPPHPPSTPQTPTHTHT